MLSYRNTFIMLKKEMEMCKRDDDDDDNDDDNDDEDERLS